MMINSFVIVLLGNHYNIFKANNSDHATIATIAQTGKEKTLKGQHTFLGIFTEPKCYDPRCSKEASRQQGRNDVHCSNLLKPPTKASHNRREK
jgi:hypothetical protein